MAMRLIAVAAACLMSVVTPTDAAGQGHAGHKAAEATAPGANGRHADETLGTVHFRTSCSPAVQPAFDRAVALMHSFQFGRAIHGFRAVLARDPDCTIADWGMALSRWSNPFAGYKSAVQLGEGLTAVEAARLRMPGTAREQAYIDAVAHLYVDSGQIDQQVRVDDYEAAMARLAADYPDDVEAKIFHALALAAAADPADKTYAKQLRAGATLEALFVLYPDHPGLAHYIIHAYDEPELAARAAGAARRYGAIAPSTPHALHMPSHTFTRIGQWQASIDTNRASAAAAKQADQPADELHASDYMVYAYLQTAQDEAARQLVLASAETFKRFDPADATGAAPASAGFFANAAIPARYCLERRDWTATQALALHPSRFPYADAITIFTRGLGAAHLNHVTTADRSIAELTAIRDQLKAADDGYWADQIEIQRLQVAAQLAVAKGDDLLARALLTRAAEMEDVTELASITPGPFVPAREMLGERLLNDSRPALALVQFQKALERQPNRFWSVYGAAQAASGSNDGATARMYFRRLLKIAHSADEPRRAALIAARAAVQKQERPLRVGG
jgi:hypothetical protein